jgi:kinesin family member 2/24
MSTFNILTRIRPPLKLEKRCIFSELNEKTLYVINQKRDILNNIVNTRRNFSFDKVYDIDYGNNDIFEDLKPIIEKTYIQKKDVTLFMYGQTGSGKTHTSMGYKDEKGLLYLWLKYIEEKGEDSNVYITSVQLHNDNCYDIFNHNVKISQLEDKNGKIHLRNCKKKYLNEISISGLIEYIKDARIVGLSSENDKSSRSHLLIQIWLKNNVVNIIDLAGSEKAVNNICSNRIQMRENANINKSIMVLKECIRSVKQKQQYIPYRQSSLTKILKDTFLNNSASIVIATLSPELRNVGDTLNTLSYISDMKSLKRQVSEPILMKMKPIEEEEDGRIEFKDRIKKTLEDLHDVRSKLFERYKYTNEDNDKEKFKTNILDEINTLHKILDYI